MTEEKTWEYQGKTWKHCPGCKKGILAEWKSHLCGWGKGEQSETIQANLKVEVKTADIVTEDDNVIGKQVLLLEKIIEVLENDTRLYALFKDDKPTLWNIIRQIYMAV
jgi:hypothetical protein